MPLSKENLACHPTNKTMVAYIKAYKPIVCPIPNFQILNNLNVMHQYALEVDQTAAWIQ